MLGRIEVHDKALLELIPVNATPERIAGGFGFTEGPGLVSRTFAIQRHTA